MNDSGFKPYSGRLCFICKAPGYCDHRELEVLEAAHYAYRRATNWISSNPDGEEERFLLPEDERPIRMPIKKADSLDGLVGGKIRAVAGAGK